MPCQQLPDDEVAINLHIASEAAKRAFNQGSDARIQGKPTKSCPYSGLLEDNLRTKWMRGWRDVDEHWGREANPRRYVHKLPPVESFNV